MFRLFIIITFYTAFSGVAAMNLNSSKKEIVLENQYLRITMINPENDYGCRFNKGGWIKNIILKDKNEKLFIENSIFPDHPAFGFTEEYIPSVELEKKQKDKSVHFKLGVGKVIRGKSIYKDKPLQLFPWKTKVNCPESVTFAQNAVNSKAYDYKLKKKVHLSGAMLHISNHLTNTGNENLSAELYLHPFFKLENDPKALWFEIPVEKSRKAVPVTTVIKGQDELFTEDTTDKGVHWVAAGNYLTKSLTGILSDVDFIKVDVWKSKGCYAVEPFIKINLKPGETYSWNWRLLFGRGLSQVSHMNAYGMTKIKKAEAGIDVIFLASKKMDNVKMRLRVLSQSGEKVQENVQKCGSVFPFKPERLSYPLNIKSKDRHKIVIDIYSNDKTVSYIEKIIEEI